jgi:hypothetical protein
MLRSVLCCLFAVVCSLGVSANAFDAHVAVTLQKSEPWVVNLFHDGHFWLGQTTDGSKPNRIEIYDPTAATKLGEVDLPHGVSFIQPYDTHSVIVLGRTPDAHAYFSVIDRDEENYNAQTYGLDWNLPEFFAVGPNSLYFNEAGNADVFNWTNGDMENLAPTISGPGRLIVVGNSLFVLEHHDMFSTDANMVKIDLRSQTTETTFDSYRNYVENLIYVPSINRIVLTETNASQLLIVNPDTNKLESTISVPTPMGLSLNGSQLAVSTGPAKGLAFVDLTTSKVTDNWDLSGVSPWFYDAWDVTADYDSGHYFVRSSNMCPTCDSSRNLVVVAQSSK